MAQNFSQTDEIKKESTKVLSDEKFLIFKVSRVES